MTDIAILGAGMAGFGAAYRFSSAGVETTLYEMQSFHGGHAASFSFSGFTFDDGPHISFTKNDRIKKLFAKSVDYKFANLKAYVNNYWKGHWIKHPAVCNLNGLPVDLVIDILQDFVEADHSDDKEVKNYEDWLIAGYGRKFAETFPMQYGKKFHTTTADNMSTEWAGPRVYRPNLREILHGALLKNTTDVHYVSGFRYPLIGGFVSYLNFFLKCADLRLNHKLIRLEPKKRLLHFENGKVVSYKHIVSSLPLPELVRMIHSTPHDVLEASEKLACTSCVIVTIGVDREDISEANWSYFYDDDFIFARVSFPHMQSPHNVPKGCGSIQTEVYYSKKYKPLDREPEECIESVIDDLKRCNLILDSDTILFRHAKIIPYANVIFDLDRSKALSIVQGYLADLDIHCCGRYGEWGYHWTDQSFVSGEKAAQKVLDFMQT